MSIPPQLIRVKRKRVDESPVTFLQFDQGVKRHRSGSNWVYQRREAGPQSPADGPVRSTRDVKPVIHVSGPDDESSRTKKPDVVHDATQNGGVSPGPKLVDSSKLAEPRRFHISRKMMMPTTTPASSGGVSKKVRYGPAVFVERSRGRMTPRSPRGVDSPRKQVLRSVGGEVQITDTMVEDPMEERRLKKPGVKSRSRSPHTDSPSHTPLPASVMNPHSEDLAKITADMNDWVMKEIGANLQSMEQEKQAERARFKPKAPAKRYQERHPGATPSASEIDMADTAMTDFSDIEDEEDWVIEEYVRIPAHRMTSDVAPTDVGLLVLEGEEDSNLFFGPEQDDDDDLDLDDEDENAENYYTADYPEDEVASDDEFGRHPYEYRNANASDDEEFDNDEFEENDEMVIEGDDDDAAMARIKAFMKQSRAFQ
ncbi:Fc.00g111780.m01.CDS01 [Cosmosporella sp. VM-42]